jgi:hypothetical protein
MSAPSNVKSYATQALSAQTVEQKLDLIAKALYEVGRSLAVLETRTNRIK